jgi:hypothetical protein
VIWPVVTRRQINGPAVLAFAGGDAEEYADADESLAARPAGESTRRSRPVPVAAEAPRSEMHFAVSARNWGGGRRLVDGKPFEEPVAFDPVFV